MAVPLMAVAAGLALTSCMSTPSAPKAAPTRVLGQQSASATVLGQPAPPGTGELGAISCADSTHCWAVGIAGPNPPTVTPTTLAPVGTTTTTVARAVTTTTVASATTTGPAPTTTTVVHATSTTAPTTTTIAGASAPTTTTTYAPNTSVTVIAATVDGGTTWSAQPLSLAATPELSGIACPTDVACMAVGSSGGVPGAGIVLVTHNGGATWTQASVPAGAFVLTAVQCANLSQCTAVISDGTNIWSARTTDFGRTWVQGGTLPAGFSDPRTITCTAGICVVAGYVPTTTGHGEGAIALSDDGGQTWVAGTVPSGTGVLQSALCLTALSCVAVGTTSTTVSDIVPATGLVLASADGGHTWTPSPSPPPVDDVYGIACPTAKVCAMVGTRWQGQPAVGTGAVARSQNGGVSFIASSSAYVPLTLTALSCPSVTACVAAGGDTLARISLPAPPAPVEPVRRPIR